MPCHLAYLLKGKERVLREGAVQVALDDLINFFLAEAAIAKKRGGGLAVAELKGAHGGACTRAHGPQRKPLQATCTLYRAPPHLICSSVA